MAEARPRLKRTKLVKPWTKGKLLARAGMKAWVREQRKALRGDPDALAEVMDQERTFKALRKWMTLGLGDRLAEVNAAAEAADQLAAAQAAREIAALYLRRVLRLEDRLGPPELVSGPLLELLWRVKRELSAVIKHARKFA